MEELAQQARDGDAEAFAALIRTCEDAFYRAAWAVLRDDHDAADALQDAALYCWEHIGELREPAHFKTWATRIVVSKSYDTARSRNRCAPADDLPDPGTNDAGYAQAEWQMMLGELCERDRLLIMLHYVDGYKVTEIARILDANENTVKTWLVKARRAYEKTIGK